MSNQKLVIIVVVIVVLIVGAGLILFLRPKDVETPASAPGPDIPAEYQEIANEAIRLVASELGVSPDDVTVLSVEPVTWSDASLGCPEPGMMYAQVITPGFLVTTQVQGETHRVHLNEQGKGVVCPPDREKSPVSN